MPAIIKQEENLMAYFDFLSLYFAQFLDKTGGKQCMLRIVIFMLRVVLALLVYLASTL